MNSDEDEWFSEHAESVLAAVEECEKAYARRPPVIISGGQTGADQAALRAARACGLETGGVAAPGYQTTIGRNLALRDVFGLSELEPMPLTTAYMTRSMRNVDASDATIAFRLTWSPGTENTIYYCITRSWPAPATFDHRQRLMGRNYRPLLIVGSLDDVGAAAQRVVKFLMNLRPRRVNICGHRDGVTAGCVDYEGRVYAVLVEAFGLCKEIDRVANNE